MAEHLLPWQGLDLRETILRVLRVHGQNLFTAGCAQDFDDLDELVDAALTREDGLSKHEFSDDTANGPNIDIRAIVAVAEN